MTKIPNIPFKGLRHSKSPSRMLWCFGNSLDNLLLCNSKWHLPLTSDRKPKFANVTPNLNGWFNVTSKDWDFSKVTRLESPGTANMVNTSISGVQKCC